MMEPPTPKPLITLKLLERALWDVSPPGTELGRHHPLQMFPKAKRPWSYRPYGRHLRDGGKAALANVLANVAEVEVARDIVDLLGMDSKDFAPRLRPPKRVSLSKPPIPKARSAEDTPTAREHARKVEAVKAVLVAATLHADDMAAPDVRYSQVETLLRDLSALYEEATNPGTPDWDSMPDGLSEAVLDAAQPILRQIRALPKRLTDPTVGYIIRSLGLVPPDEEASPLRIEPLPPDVSDRIRPVLKAWVPVSEQARGPVADIAWRLVGVALYEAMCRERGCRVAH